MINGPFPNFFPLSFPKTPVKLEYYIRLSVILLRAAGTQEDRGTVAHHFWVDQYTPKTTDTK